jgi:ABC-type glycerol-3-phosphate transport system substrate-binding protein
VRRFTVVAAALGACALAGCSSTSSTSTPATPSATGSASSPASPTGAITVFAAASLMGTFTQLGKQFEAAHPGDTVKFSFGPSSGLATEITSGAPTDMFASAAPANMGADDAITAMMRRAVSSWFETGDLELEDPPGFARLGEIRVPAVMLLGDLEYPMVSQASRAIAAKLDGCGEVLVPGADHLLPLRDPLRLAGAIGQVAG